MKLLLVCMFAFVFCIISAFGVEQSDYVGFAVAGAVVVGLGVPSYDLERLKIPVSEFHELKAKFGNLYIIDIVVDATESYQFIVRRPDRSVLKAVHANKDDLEKANDILIKNMVVAGNMEAVEDGIVYGQLLKSLSELMEQGSRSFTKA